MTIQRAAASGQLARALSLNAFEQREEKLRPKAKWATNLRHVVFTPFVASGEATRPGLRRERQQRCAATRARTPTAPARWPPPRVPRVDPASRLGGRRRAPARNESHPRDAAAATQQTRRAASRNCHSSLARRVDSLTAASIDGVTAVSRRRHLPGVKFKFIFCSELMTCVERRSR